MSFEWESDPAIVFSEAVDEGVMTIRLMVRAVLLSFAPVMEAWMKDNAPWTDRTGNLRASLHTELETFSDAFALTADYGLDYGVFLELANSGQYSIIALTIDVFAPKIFDALERVFR